MTVLPGRRPVAPVGALMMILAAASVGATGPAAAFAGEAARVPLLRQKQCFLLSSAQARLAPQSSASSGTPDEPSEELAQRVETLVGQLSAETLQDRVQAQKALLELGPKVLPLLPAPEVLADASARDAVERLRARLEHRKARESVQPGRVTLKGDFPLTDLLERIAAQTGNRIDASELPPPTGRETVEVDYRRETFWTVIDELARRLELRFVTEGRSLQLLPRSEHSAGAEERVAYAGAFRVAVRAVERRKLFGDERHDLLRVGFSLSAEPRLRPLFLAYSAKDITAETAAGRALAPLNPEADYELPLGAGGRHLRAHADFKLPASVQAGTIRLSGRLKVHAAAGAERFVFHDPAGTREVARRRGGVTVRLQKAEFRESSSGKHEASVHVTVGYDAGGPAFESHRRWIFHNEASLQTEDDRRIDVNGGYRTSLEADGGVAVVYRFRQLQRKPDGYRFVYVAPTLLIDVPVEFEFAKLSVTDSRSKRSTPEERTPP